jgi:hypothetical protein
MTEVLTSVALEQATQSSRVFYVNCAVKSLTRSLMSRVFCSTAYIMTTEVRIEGRSVVDFHCMLFVYAVLHELQNIIGVLVR